MIEAAADSGSLTPVEITPSDRFKYVNYQYPEYLKAACKGTERYWHRQRQPRNRNGAYESRFQGLDYQL
jgi:hypothetical protein